MNIVESLHQAVLRGDTEASSALAKAALEARVAPEQILKDGLISAMDVVGREFQSGIRFIPEMLVSAEAMKAAMQVLRPRLIEQGVKSRGKVVIGTVEGDLHDIGKDLVATMLEGAGFEIVDLGVDVSPQQFADAVRAHQPQIVAMSALLSTTMAVMPRVIEALREAGLRNQVRVIVGGAPVTREFAAEIGADGYADDATRAVSLAETLTV